MSEYTPGQVAAGDQRVAEVRKHVDRIVWQWRMTTYKHQCGPEGCGIDADPARQAAVFSEVLQETFGTMPDGFGLLCEALTVAVSPDDPMGFCEKVEHDFRYLADGIGLLCDWLTIAVAVLAKNPVPAPKHSWVAAQDSAQCSCGWHFGTSDPGVAVRQWTAHAGDRLLLHPWQQRWLEDAYGKA